MTIAEIQAEIIQEFDWLGDWEEKYQYIIDLGKELPPYPEAFRTPVFKVSGCQSQVWLHSRLEGGKVWFDGDSDALIVKGLVALLLRVYSGHSPEEILNHPPDFIQQIGLGSHLSPTRSNGLASMVNQIRNYAIAYRTQA